MKTKLLILSVFLCSSARAADEFPALSFSGRVFGDLYLPLKDHTGTRFQQASTSAWLEGDAKLSPALSARAEYQGDYFANARLTGDRSGPHLRNRLREGWAEYFADGIQLRAGKQIIPWGKSDGVNPTDYLSAHESNFLNHDGEVNRVGGTALLAGFTPDAGASPFSILLIGQPAFPQSDYLIPPTALPAGVTLSDAETPERSFNNTEAAAKASYSGSGWDASLSWFHGFDHSPVFAESSHTTLAPGVTFVRARRIFQHLNAVGGDASIASGPWVWRLESAYLFTGNDGNPLFTPSHWDSVLGLERPLWEKFRLQGQFISRYFPHWSDPAQAAGPDAVSAAINRQIAAANALLHQYQHRWGAATTLRASYSLDEPGFTAELLWYQGLNDGDHYLRPMLSYALKEFLKLYVGCDLYGGPEGKSIGSLQTYNAAFTELKATF